MRFLRKAKEIRELCTETSIRVHHTCLRASHRQADDPANRRRNCGKRPFMDENQLKNLLLIRPITINRFKRVRVHPKMIVLYNTLIIGNKNSHFRMDSMTLFRRLTVWQLQFKFLQQTCRNFYIRLKNSTGMAGFKKF